MHYSRTDVKAMGVLAVLLASVAAGVYCWMRCTRDPVLELSQEKVDAIFAMDAEARRDSLFDAAVHREGLDPEARLFRFDPNHADSATLRRLGLSARQVRNMMAYRRKGGRWRSPDDFARLYGLSHEDFERLRSYISIAPEDRWRDGHASRREPDYYGTPLPDKPDYERVDKLKEGDQVDVNVADTAELKRVPGIGSFYARKIVAYRDSMGGFVHARQVGEVKGLPAGVSRWFRVGEHFEARKLHINHASFKKLVHHPYISYEQTKAIVNHIRRYGPIRSWRDLRLYDEFSEEDFRRLTPYVSFD